MANFVFNVAKGRVAEFYNRVAENDPTDSGLVLLILNSTGLESDATLKDYDTVAAILAASNNEAAGVGYARIVLTDADIDPLSIDDTNDLVDLDLPDQTWASVASGTWSKLIIAYDPDTIGGTDSELIPLTCHDFSVTADGSDITAVIGANGFYRAS